MLLGAGDVLMAVRGGQKIRSRWLQISLYALVFSMTAATARVVARAAGNTVLDSVGALATATAAALVVVIAVALIVNGKTSLRPFGRIWLSVFGLMTLASLCVGLIAYNNDPSEASKDLASYVFFGSAVVMGSSRSAWSVLRGPLLLACTLSVLLAVIGVVQFRQVAVNVAAGTRLAGRDTSLNNILPVFGILPILLFTLPWWRRAELLAIVLAWSSAVTAAVLLQSRLEFSYWVLCGLIAGAIVVTGYCTRGYRPAVNRSFIALVSAGVIVAALAMFGGTIGAQASSLLERFDGKINKGSAYEDGALGVIGSENERWAILADCWNDFEWTERIRGRGMGGSFTWLTPIIDARNENSRREREEVLWLEDARTFGRRQIEVGWGNPFIKGGLLLSGWMILGTVVAIVAAVRSRSPFAIACALAVLVNGAYAVFGGDFIIGALAKMLGAGLPIGFLLSRGWRSDPWVGILRARPRSEPGRRIPSITEPSAQT